MARARRIFNREFKLSLLSDSRALRCPVSTTPVVEIEAGAPIAQVARENGVHPTLVSRWKQEYRANPDKAFQGHGNPYKDQAKMAELERIVGQLYAENAFLKKTLEKLGRRVQEERNGSAPGSVSP